MAAARHSKQRALDVEDQVEPEDAVESGVQ